MQHNELAIAMTEGYKARSYGPSLSGIAVSNPAGTMDDYLL